MKKRWVFFIVLLLLLLSSVNARAESWKSTRVSLPEGRSEHTAVWSGSRMIIWGGFGGRNTGGQYDPVTGTWTPTTTTGAPTARNSYTTIWTGTEMIVWGGYGSGYLNTGARYHPSTDT